MIKEIRKTNQGMMLRRLKKLRELECLKLMLASVKSDEAVRLIYENRKDR